MHAVVRNGLLDDFRSGKFSPGDQIPTEPELIEQYAVSRTTVRRALRDLEQMGLIDRQPGRGSFLRPPRVEPRLDRLTGFVEDMQALGLEASALVRSIETIPAPPEAAAALKLSDGTPVVRIQRVRLANGTPISFDDSYLVKEVGDRVAGENLKEEPFYSIFEHKYGILLAGADFTVTARLGDVRVARELEIPEGAPILLVKRTSCVKPDRTPILYERLYYAGERMNYRLSLER